MRSNPNLKPWSWREMVKDLAFAIFVVLAAYVIFKYGGTRYASEGAWPPPPEYTETEGR